MRLRVTMLFVSVTAALSMQVQAQQTITDSQHIDVGPGIYQTTADGKDGDVLVALETGSITATDATVIASGSGVYSVYASEGGKIDLKGGSVTTTGSVGAALVTLGASSHISADGTVIRTQGLFGLGVDDYGGTMTLSNGSITTFGDQAYGVLADGAATGDGVFVTMSNESVTTHGKGRAAAVLAGPNATLQIRDSTIQTDGNHHGLYVDNRDTEDTSYMVANNLTVRTASGQAAMLSAGGQLTIAGSTLASQSGVALYAYNASSRINRAIAINSTLSSAQNYALYNKGGEFDVILDNTTARGNAVLGSDYFDPTAQQGASSTQLTANNHTKLYGNVVIASGNNATLALNTGSLLQGALLQGAAARIDLNLDNTSTWQVSGDSTLHNLNNLGNVTFDTGNGYHQARVNGDYNGGGAVTVHTYLNAGGALANQYTDRLLIDGNVTGTTVLNVQASGSGANTNVAGDHQLHGNEGISVVQVGGNATAASFKLAHDYIAAAGSPIQYRLFAYQGAAVDDGQKLLPTVNWDYRLQAAYLDDDGHIIPGAPDGQNDPPPDDQPTDGQPDPASDGSGVPLADPPANPLAPGRPLLAPQISSYLTAPLALHSYDTLVLDGLRQRLGEVRQGDANSAEGEVYLRQLADAGSYQSNLDFSRFGYGFRRQAHALQFGGNWLHLMDDTQDLRVGAAVTFGDTHYRPATLVPEEASQTDVHARHWALTATWLQAEGWYADAIVSAAHYHGEVHTPARGTSGRLGAHGVQLSLEGGRTLTLANGLLIEPSVQLQHARIATRISQDADDLHVAIDPSRTTTLEGGIRAAWPLTQRVVPYARLAIDHVWCSGAQATVADLHFDTGCLGSGVKLGVGAHGQLAERLAVYGEVDGERRLGSYGVNGVAGTLGLRYDF